LATVAAGEARDDLDHAVHTLEIGLHAPEAAARDDGRADVLRMGAMGGQKSAVRIAADSAISLKVS
jgi:hypothetical protein